MYLKLFATPALIACILCALVGIYVFCNNTKNIQNRVFAMFIVFAIAFSIGEAMLRFSNSSEEGMLWGRIGYLGVIFVPLSLLHLSFVFPQKSNIITRKKYLLSGMYIVGLLLFCIFNLLISKQDVQWSNWGYRVAFSPKFYLIGMWLLITSGFGAFNFFNSYIHSRTVVERKQVAHIFYGAFIVIVLTFGTNILPPIFNIEVFPLGSISLSIFAIFIGAAILKYNLFRFKSMVEPATERKEAGPKRYKLKSSMNYIVKEEQDGQGFEIFTDQIMHGISGLCITKYHPQSIREKYGFEKTPLFWFTFEDSDKEKIVNPQKMSVELIPQVEDFVKKGNNTLVYLDCFDQIKLVKGFENTLSFIKDIKSICNENNSTLLLSIKPELFEKEQIMFFEKEFTEVR